MFDFRYCSVDLLPRPFNFIVFVCISIEIYHGSLMLISLHLSYPSVSIFRLSDNGSTALI